MSEEEALQFTVVRMTELLQARTAMQLNGLLEVVFHGAIEMQADAIDTFYPQVHEEHVRSALSMNFTDSEIRFLFLTQGILPHPDQVGDSLNELYLNSNVEITSAAGAKETINFVAFATQSLNHSIIKGGTKEGEGLWDDYKGKPDVVARISFLK